MCFSIVLYYGKGELWNMNKKQKPRLKGNNVAFGAE